MIAAGGNGVKRRHEPAGRAGRAGRAAMCRLGAEEMARLSAECEDAGALPIRADRRTSRRPLQPAISSGIRLT